MVVNHAQANWNNRSVYKRSFPTMAVAHLFWAPKDKLGGQAKVRGLEGDEGDKGLPPKAAGRAIDE